MEELSSQGDQGFSHKMPGAAFYNKWNKSCTVELTGSFNNKAQSVNQDINLTIK